MKIMFICTGNICRSAMAEAMFKKLAKEKNKEIEVYSSGTTAYTGDKCTDNAIEVMNEYGINIKNHRATNIKESNIEQMDLILCATASHKQMVDYLYPNLKDKVYTIKEFAQKNEKEKEENINISDPWGYEVQVYRSCAKEIYESLQKIISII